MNEEILIKLSLLEQQSQEVKQQLESVESQAGEMESLKACLSRLEEGKKDILANLGKGIFINAKIERDEVFVNVGSKTFVKKKISEAKEIVNTQLKELENIKASLVEAIDAINSNLQDLIEEAKNQKEK